MRATERLLGHGYRYSERPRRSGTPLMEFLFGQRSGYCQHFSGAMALLLRLAGVPARVAAGFSPGVFDHTRKEYVVRDYDAHSWVEVFFPGIGWVTRDPTPSDSPARSQLDDGVRAARDGALDTPADTRGGPAPRADAATSGATSPALHHRPSPVLGIAAAVAGALALIAVLLAVRRRRRAAAVGVVAEPLAELRRALRRSGLPPSPQTTLETLAWRYRGTAAEGYLRTLAAARYGYGGGPPTRAQRAALRRQLGCGRGPGRRLRAWWALPPRAPAWRLARKRTAG
jgi:hypothetical protein